VIRLIRAEFYKLRTTSGPWVVGGVLMLLTCGEVALAFLATRHGHAHFLAPHTTQGLRNLMGAGYAFGVVLVPVLGVLCVTTEYRHKVLTATLLYEPRRGRVLAAKVVCALGWGVILCVLTLVIVAAMGIPLLVTQGGSLHGLLRQSGPVLPGLFGAFALLGVYGMGIGTLVKNQIAGVIVAVGLSLILEPILVVVFSHVWHIDLNFLPQRATQALAGGLTDRQGSRLAAPGLLPWWQGGLALLGWGIVPTVLGYFTTFRRDVT
jgi:ABC-type transport system involved in multi-copper enzyme maturation permease subunit